MLHSTTYNKETNTFTFTHTKEIRDIEDKAVVVVDFVRERTLEEVNLEIQGCTDQKADLEKKIERLHQEKAAAESLL